MNFKFSTKTLSTSFLNTAYGSTVSYGSNGLPATPNSISIIGYFKSNIENVDNRFLIKYLDCYRNKDETITFVSEFYEQDNDYEIDYDQLIYCLVNGLYYLHFELDTVHGFIHPSNVIRDHNSDFKLNDWPFNSVTLFGKLLDVQSFLPKNLQFLSPERIINLNLKPSKKSDVWSLALTILFLIDNNIKLPKNPADFLLCKTSKDVLRVLAAKNIPAKYEKFFNLALEPLIEKRCSIDSLLDLVKELNLDNEFSTIKDNLSIDKSTSHLDNLSIKELYYFWKLSKGYRKKIEFNDFKLSIFNLPNLVKLNQLNYTIHTSDNGIQNNSNCIDQIAFMPSNDQTVVDLLDDLLERLNSLDRTIFYPILFTHLKGKSPESFLNNKHHLERDKESILNLPLIIKENDFEYQVERTLLFKRLVNEQPFTKERLKEEAKIDIPPFFRAQIWASLLQVKHKELYLYRRIIKETNINTDRQISVDIPRCHQYNELLSSPSGHLKLKRILKAWLKHNEDKYVYWQGKF